MPPDHVTDMEQGLALQEAYVPPSVSSFIVYPERSPRLKESRCTTDSSSMATVLSPNVHTHQTEKGRSMAVPIEDKDNTDGKHESRPNPPAPSFPDRASSSQVIAPKDFRKEAERRATLQLWPCKFLNADVAARNGFYYTGKEDCLTCAFCKVELSHWKEGDDIEADHGRWSPHCPFLLRKPVGNIPMSRDECGFMESSSFKPAHTLYRTEATRFKTFKYWPIHMKQTPAMLAAAGFYYSGSGDQTICYYCGGGLKDWEDGDDPWEQHALWFGKCPYLINMKGETFIKDTILKSKTPVAQPVPPPAGESAPPKPSTLQMDTANNHQQPLKSAESSQEEKAPAEDASEKKVCKICYEQERNVCFVPCGHVVACIKCAMSVSQCPVCREPYTKLVKLFFS